MHDAAGVGVGQRLGDVAQDGQDVIDGEAVTIEPVAERFAFHERHGEPGQAVDVTGGEQRDDIGLLQRGRQQDLPLEALRIQPLHQLGVEHLDDHPAGEPHFVGHEDARHPPATELALDEEGGTETGLQLGPEVHGYPCADGESGWGDAGGKIRRTGEWR